MATRKRNSKDRLKKIAVTVYIEPAQAEGLAELSERTRRPQSIYYREGIDYVLDKYKKEGRK